MESWANGQGAVSCIHLFLYDFICEEPEDVVVSSIDAGGVGLGLTDSCLRTKGDGGIICSVQFV